MEAETSGQFRRIAPAWNWLRENFSLPAVLTIAGVLAASTGYIVSLRTRVTVLEHDVVYIEQAAPDKAVITDLQRQTKDQGERITRLEQDYDIAYQHAGDPIPRRRH